MSSLGIGRYVSSQNPPGLRAEEQGCAINNARNETPPRQGSSREYIRHADPPLRRQNQSCRKTVQSCVKPMQCSHLFKRVNQSDQVSPMRFE